MTSLNLDTVPRRRTFELDQVVVGAVGGEEGSAVLKVLAFRLALERLVARLAGEFKADGSTREVRQEGHVAP